MKQIKGCADRTAAILFHRPRFANHVIVWRARWYLRFKLSYREMTEIARELGVLMGVELAAGQRRFK